MSRDVRRGVRRLVGLESELDDGDGDEDEDEDVCSWGWGREGWEGGLIALRIASRA